MPRPKSFDKSELLGRAMLLFWERGYEKTSLKDLEVTFGLTPPSIYHTFGNKQDLFLSVLDYYLEAVIDSRIKEYLNKSPNPIHDLEKFFLSGLGYLVKDKPRFGCLLTNTASETTYLTESSDQRIQDGLARLRDAFYKELIRAQTTGHLNTGQDAAELAMMLLTSFQGFLVLARLKISDRKLQQGVKSVINMLNK
jgi:TetR/AcrR family transcriptional regulator, transcriptional repressor for nem operon